jgi:hypothetical protein
MTRLAPMLSRGCCGPAPKRFVRDIHAGNYATPGSYRFIDHDLAPSTTVSGAIIVTDLGPDRQPIAAAPSPGTSTFGLGPGYPRGPTSFRYRTRCASVTTSSLDAPRHLACMPDIWASAS